MEFNFPLAILIINLLSLIEPKFSGQTKDRLTNRKSDFDKFIKIFRAQLDVFADRHEDQLKD